MKKTITLIAIFAAINFSIAQTQQWLTVLNATTTASHVLNAQNPWNFNPSQTKIAAISTAGGQPFVGVLNTLNGSLVYNATQPITATGNALGFDGSDNLFTLAASPTNPFDAFFKKYNSTGTALVNTTINNYIDDNYNQLKVNQNNNVFLYGLNSAINTGYLSSSVYSYNNAGTLQWTSTINDLDWYYGYTGRMILDNTGNVIFTGKRQTTQMNQNTYDVVVRKVNSAGIQQWQIYYDFNNLQDHMCNGNSALTSDNNGDIYFVSRNNNALSNNTVRLVKLNGLTGAVIFQQQIGASGIADIVINSNSEIIIAGIDNQVKSYNSTNGSLLWSKSFANIQSASTDINSKIYVTTNDKLRILSSAGALVDSITVAITSYSVTHRRTQVNAAGNEIYILGDRTASSITKNFIAKYSLCQGSASITPQGATSFCIGGSVTLNANTGTGLTYQWMLNGVNISGATSSNYQANQAGSYTVKVINGSCNLISAPVSVVVNSNPTSTLSSIVNFINIYDNAIVLSGSPVGGTFSGPGVTGNTFNPQTAGLGNKTVQYAYTDGLGCTGKSFASTIVYDTTGVICTTTNTITIFVSVTDTLIINSTITSLTPPNNTNTIKVFPNPTNDHITINYGNFAAMNGYTLKITNALGQIVFTSPINHQSSYIDLSTWGGNGIYFVQIMDTQNNTIENRKIVLQ
jgi:hypothetical protein